LLVRFGHGDIERGGVHLGEAVQGRRRGEWYLPESGRLVPDDGGWHYAPDPPKNFEFHGWEETVKDLFYAEMIISCESQDPGTQLGEGRRNLASFKTMLELHFGLGFWVCC
jgi:hypothetical protein